MGSVIINILVEAGGSRGQSGHLDTPHPGPVYFVCYNLLSSISKTSVSWKNSRRLVLVTPSAME